MAEQTFHLTKQGLERIQKEHDKLVEFKRLKTKGDVPSIWHSEDVNPEYLAFQEDMTLLETKLAEYENILKNVELIILPPKERRKEICLGATVWCEVDGEKDEFTIVGSLECNPSAGKISDESPVGKALLGHRIGETIVVHSSVKVPYRILTISYGSDRK
ncbi:MAG: transcription elongation factor GreA [Parcubacteria group bacterium Greene0714_21]|nr:MAG: transcription elongation factor GreA [Parcubacteria group bacterium Greene0416_39]TSC97329.1 MAG: transcription elongation factor GreA [Parcubacteria group bacterium Greene1014_47]TSD03943.1 MAG: transcription elongation factor GreA [Parcubacteria group bacterium Greene0714_21]